MKYAKIIEAFQNDENFGDFYPFSSVQFIMCLHYFQGFKGILKQKSKRYLEVQSLRAVLVFR